MPPAATNPKWYPPRFDDNETDNAFKTAFDRIYANQEQSVRGATNGMAMAAGSATVTGSENGIATGLSSVLYVVAGLGGSDAVNEWVTSLPTPKVAGKIDLYVWKPTAAGNTTPIASTTARAVNWVAIGSK